jgi:hypothetical protein
VTEDCRPSRTGCPQSPPRSQAGPLLCDCFAEQLTLNSAARGAGDCSSEKERETSRLLFPLVLFLLSLAVLGDGQMHAA